jgi:hypothetical protein
MQFTFGRRECGLASGEMVTKKQKEILKLVSSKKGAGTIPESFRTYRLPGYCWRS